MLKRPNVAITFGLIGVGLAGMGLYYALPEVPFIVGQRLVPGDWRSERLGDTTIGEECFRRPNDLE